VIAPSPEVIALAKTHALSRGDMRPLMTRTQRETHRRFQSTRKTDRRYVLDCSRRFGKTILGACVVHEEALVGPNRILRICAPSKVHGRQFVIPAFEWVRERVPEAQRPTFHSMDNMWKWPNGSRCYLGSAETLRDCDAQVGTELHLGVLDEAGKYPVGLLDHMVGSVFGKSLLTTRGSLLITSTPAISQAHELSRYVAEGAANGTLSQYTIEDCDHIEWDYRMFTIADDLQLGSIEARAEFHAALLAAPSMEERKRLIMESGSLKAFEVLRELYCEHITEKSRMIVPEWADVAATSVCELEPPEYVDWYAAGDFGFEDLSVVLYAWFNFEEQFLYVADEVVKQYASSLEVGADCKALEAHWGIRPLTRVADAPLQLLADLSHPTLGPGINFAPTQKDDADAVLAHLRGQVGRGKIRVHPRCKTLIAHLKFGTWNERRTHFDRQDGYGHWDAIDALKYLNRAVNRRKNPAPIIPANVHGATHWVSPDLQRLAKQRQRMPLGRGGKHV
jgi:hypothetical protein